MMKIESLFMLKW